MDSARKPLHDLSSRSRQVQISVDASVAYDLILVLWAALGGDDKASAHALGQSWFDDFRTALPSKTIKLAEKVSPHAVAWPALLGVIEGAPVPHNPDSVIEWLKAQDPTFVRQRLIAEQFCDFDPKVVAEAASGDTTALDMLLDDPQIRHKEADFKSSLRASMMLDAEEMVGGLIEVMIEARKGAFQPFERQWADALERDAIDKRIDVSNASGPRELIETVSNGISYEVPPGVRRIVVIPSVSLRPWTLITDFAEGLLVCCPVSEEALNSDPDAPPSWMVATYRALGDEKRLRMLRRLAENPASLAELTEYLGLAKSTVFHHIGVLRAAGLVRVALAADDRENLTYSLRFDSIPDRAALIEQYLSPARKEAKP